MKERSRLSTVRELESNQKSIIFSEHSSDFLLTEELRLFPGSRMSSDPELVHEYE